MDYGEKIMSIDLNNYENLCKDERQKIIVSRDDDEKSSSGKKCEHRALNKNQSLVRQYKIDGNIFVEGKKCDFLVLNDDRKDAYLIELKRSKINEGIEQLESTYERIKSSLPNYQFLFRLVHAGTNTHGVISQKTIRWREKHGKTADGKIIADLQKTPYTEEI